MPYITMPLRAPEWPEAISLFECGLQISDRRFVGALLAAPSAGRAAPPLRLDLRPQHIQEFTYPLWMARPRCRCDEVPIHIRIGVGVVDLPPLGTCLDQLRLDSRIRRAALSLEDISRSQYL